MPAPSASLVRRGAPAQNGGVNIFGAATQEWFEGSFAAPTAVQRDGWQAIASGAHTLLLAPTGSGKTLAAFLWCIDRLAGRLTADSTRVLPGVRVVYVSPLKALVYDIERNLRAPLAGIAGVAERAGQTLVMPRVAVRTGDTSQTDRRRQARHPAEILVTTPESLYLILGSGARETLRTVDTVIVDEVHAVAPTKRGAHLALSLERLASLTTTDPQRIGLSATAQPVSEVGRFLGGDRAVSVVDAAMAPVLDIRIVVPVPNMERPDVGRPPKSEPRNRSGPSVEGASLGPEPDRGHVNADPPTSIWPAIYPELLALIRAHHSTIIFTNSRGLCERLAHRLNEQAGCELVRAHHGSIAHHQRTQIEEMLKEGTLRAIVATSSLELGIDMGAVDLVVLVESPGSVARGLQRVGRAGHGVGEISAGRIFPKYRGDLLESAVVVREMLDGHIEPLRVPRNPLDVLAQQLVAMCALDPWRVPDVETLVRRTASFAELGRAGLVATLDMLSGRYPSVDFADLKPRLSWNRETDVLTGRRGSRMLALVSGGTIPDRGLYAVHLGPDGARVGELDEEMVHESRPGQTFTLGASTWRIEEITRDRVIVSPAPGETGTLPFWKGEGPGRPIELGRTLGAFVRELTSKPSDGAVAWLKQQYALDTWAAENLRRYVSDQQEATGEVPTDRTLIIERFRDELGDWRICILSPFGARVHAPWALAVEASLSAHMGFEVQSLWSDDGIVLRLADADELPAADLLVPDPDTVEDRLIEQLGHSALFASRFRENAARALLLPRRRPGGRTPLWAQRLRAQNLLAVVRQHPSFPIVLETYRDCLQDVFDLPALKALLHAVRRREIRVVDVETRSASPFARSLVFAYVDTYMYESHAPMAETRAHALALDRSMLRELLGHEELRALLDAGEMEALEAELQWIAASHQARHADGLHDMLRRVGDLTLEEIGLRCAEDPEPWLATLAADHRAVRIDVGAADRPRWIAIEDTALYRDALDAVPPADVPAVFLEARSDDYGAPLEALLVRWARTHCPFVTRTVAHRYGLMPHRAQQALESLVAGDRLLQGEFRPGGLEQEWCDPDVLRRLRLRTLARLRNEVSPVESAVLARFLPAWHGIGVSAPAAARLLEVIAQLEGMPLSFKALEQAILPARVQGYQPRMLDELGAMGQVVWVGHGALGNTDGRIALYRRERVALLLEPDLAGGNTADETHLDHTAGGADLAGGNAAEASDHEGALCSGIVAHLTRRGASFQFELSAACGHPKERDLLDAMWQLVWAGRVTNDTFQPLRALGTRGRSQGGRRRARSTGRVVGGRWSVVDDLLRGGPEPTPPSPTERAHTRAQTLLARWGVVCRSVVTAEALPGGFTSVYPVLRAMETAGKARRGYFVEALAGAQFAYPGAVDRLRAARALPAEPHALALSAIDPANPYGVLLPWPQPTLAGAAAPRRAAGRTVILVNGEPVIYVERDGRHLTTFAAAKEADNALHAARALIDVARRKRGQMLRVERIDGESARSGPWAATFMQAGFKPDYRGLTLEVR